VALTAADRKIEAVQATPGPNHGNVADGATVVELEVEKLLSGLGP
jgi:hypothetical protein